MWKCGNVTMWQVVITFLQTLIVIVTHCNPRYLLRTGQVKKERITIFSRQKKKLFSFSLLFVFCSLCHLMETFFEVFASRYLVPMIIHFDDKPPGAAVTFSRIKFIFHSSKNFNHSTNDHKRRY
jgi:hypothetical protein